MCSATDLVLDADATMDRALQSLDGKPPEVLLVRLNPTGWSSVIKQELEGMIKEGKGGETLLRFGLGARFRFCIPIIRWRRRCVTWIVGRWSRW